MVLNPTAFSISPDRRTSPDFAELPWKEHFKSLPRKTDVGIAQMEKSIFRQISQSLPSRREADRATTP
jgi:hypothetical protein